MSKDIVNLPPFYVGQNVVVIESFEKLRKVWGWNYPKKNTIVQVTSIKKHPKYNFWLITIPVCECELCHRCFAPIEEVFKSVSLTKILEQETKLISTN